MIPVPSAHLEEPMWLRNARKYTGLAEIPGPKSNPKILEMARAIGAPAWYHNDDQPWCAVFGNFALLENRIPMALGTRDDKFDRLRARTFLSWGQRLSGPALGAICVFDRPEGAHVGFYLGECGDLIRVYGGNQKNQVCATWIKRERLAGYRWPPGLALPTIAPILLSGDGAVISTNEG